MRCLVVLLAPANDQVRVSGKFFRVGARKWLLKGVTYGPFQGEHSLPPRERVVADLQQIKALGFNTLRLYAPPPRWFLEDCHAWGLRVLVGLQWPAHTDFLRDWFSVRDILRQARTVVRELREEPALLGFIVGNEIPATLVRWMGAARVERFLDRLIGVCRKENPEALFVYASYPTTEYLNPRSADFVASLSLGLARQNGTNYRVEEVTGCGVRRDP